MVIFKQYLSDLAEVGSLIDQATLDSAYKLIREARSNKKKVLIIGNGGSNALSSHLAVDLIKVGGVTAMSFSDAAMLTCLSNDFGYNHWCEYVVATYASEGDVLIAISSSGESENIILGVQKALSMGLEVITLSGFASENRLGSLGSVNLWASSSNYNFVETAHQLWLLYLSDRLGADVTNVEANLE